MDMLGHYDPSEQLHVSSGPYLEELVGEHISKSAIGEKWKPVDARERKKSNIALDLKSLQAFARWLLVVHEGQCCLVAEHGLPRTGKPWYPQI